MTALQQPAALPAPDRPDARTLRDLAYDDRLRTLSEASVHQHFDAFLDIDWDHPDHVIRPDDERWILPALDALGGTGWYRALPHAEQIRVGLYRQANITKVGLQFEQILVSGLMNHAYGLPNGSPEFRYATHEATEECHHTQMFQEFVNRSGADVAGAGWLFTHLGPFLPLAARWVPYIFFYGVLAGEEPIDHVQKSVLRSGARMHPLLRRIMQIHVAEEARHIGFAHTYLEHNAVRLSRRQRAILSVAIPIVMRALCDEILVPSRRAQRDMGIPDSVIKQLYWRDEASRKFLRDLFGDVRMLVEDSGLMNRFSRRVWRWMRIDGRPSRFRSEPAALSA